MAHKYCGVCFMRALVICNAYPSDQALYRNGFIHRRVKAYQAAGIGVDVFYEHAPASTPYSYDYDGVNVRVGNEDALEVQIRTGNFDAYLVHFAEPSRINPLRRLDVKQPVIVWIHGFEAEAWHRRWFNFTERSTDIFHAVARKKSYFHAQNKFMRDLITDDRLNLSFVNVSRWFEEYVVDPDIGTEIPDSVVIPNIIDETLFNYEIKNADDRKKILSIRPFASRKYANDITVKAIVELSKRPFFSDLEFTICGQGPLFNRVTEPLRKFSNVTLRQAFFSQSQIKELHSSHGIFVSPTRFDSQGVSMCEAMSSGLATISTDIAAIPEYLHHMETGLLSEPESAQSLADNIERLYFDEELFRELSAAGSDWIRANCGHDATIGREISLITGKVKP